MKENANNVPTLQEIRHHTRMSKKKIVFEDISKRVNNIKNKMPLIVIIDSLIKAALLYSANWR